MAIKRYDAQTRSADARPTYKRILVLLDGSSAGEQAINAAVTMAARDGSELVLICTEFPGARRYIDTHCAALKQQRINASGYTFREDVADLPAWLLNAEKADAIIFTRKTASRLGRLFGVDTAAALQRRTNADIIEITV